MPTNLTQATHLVELDRLSRTLEANGFEVQLTEASNSEDPHMLFLRIPAERLGLPTVARFYFSPFEVDELESVLPLQLLLHFQFEPPARRAELLELLNLLNLQLGFGSLMLDREDKLCFRHGFSAPRDASQSLAPLVEALAMVLSVLDAATPFLLGLSEGKSVASVRRALEDQINGFS